VLFRSVYDRDFQCFTPSPAYVFHATGAMKALLDHFAYRWMPHRPAPEMFTKRAVILTQCLGAGAKSAARDIKHSLSWWGVPKIGIFTRSASKSDLSMTLIFSASLQALSPFSMQAVQPLQKWGQSLGR